MSEHLDNRKDAVEMGSTERLASFRDAACVVGIGDTDYRADHARSREGNLFQDAYGHAATAFERALADSGLKREDIDGLISGPSLATERTGEVLGIDPRWSTQADAVNAVIDAAMAIHAGLAECVALVYGNDQRAVGTQYGGPKAMGGERYLAYVYYAPWGLTSQGALYAMTARRYMDMTGFSVEDLGEIVIGQRRFAELNPNAIMREPLTLAQYIDGRLICEPLRLYDYCLVNDGGVTLIVTTRDRARTLKQRPIFLAGVGTADLNSDATMLRPRLIDFYHSGHQRAAKQVYEMAGMGPEDMDLLQIYDSFSIHVPIALEGFGFCREGEVQRLVAGGATGPGGRLPINTSGGHLSESYMQGWNHQVEAVRQLRGMAGERQVRNAKTAQYISDVAGKVASLVYRRGEA